MLWNTVYIEKAIEIFRQRGEPVHDSLLQHLSPLSWEHINLTGNYLWKADAGARNGSFRPLRIGPDGRGRLSP